jgi:YgiT-type zinc finger domain-containing protein
MKCVICKQGETRPGVATVMLEREGAMLIVKSVPAQVCQNCGEEYLDDDITAKILQQAEEAVRAGVQMTMRTYAAT